MSTRNREDRFSLFVPHFPNYHKCMWFLFPTKVPAKEEGKGKKRSLRMLASFLMSSWFLVCFPTGGGRERPGDEEAGSLGVPGQRRDLH